MVILLTIDSSKSVQWWLFTVSQPEILFNYYTEGEQTKIKIISTTVLKILFGSRQQNIQIWPIAES